MNPVGKCYRLAASSETCSHLVQFYKTLSTPLQSSAQRAHHRGTQRHAHMPKELGQTEMSNSSCSWTQRLWPDWDSWAQRWWCRALRRTPPEDWGDLDWVWPPHTPLLTPTSLRCPPLPQAKPPWLPGYCSAWAPHHSGSPLGGSLQACHQGPSLWEQQNSWLHPS